MKQKQQQKQRQLNWKELGRFVSVLVQLFTIVTDVFKKAKVELEVVGWLVGEGKDLLVSKLEELAREFVKMQVIITPPAPPTLRAEVDTDLDPELPFDVAIIDTHIKMGTVVIEKRGDELFINDRKVILSLSEHQLNGRSLKGYELREELTGKPVLNACILDFLHANPHFIPESWKQDEAGNTIYIYFWGTIYRNAGGGLCVRCLYWDDGAWDRGDYWLGNGWGGRFPAALLAS